MLGFFFLSSFPEKVFRMILSKKLQRTPFHFLRWRLLWGEWSQNLGFTRKICHTVSTGWMCFLLPYVIDLCWGIVDVWKEGEKVKKDLCLYILCSAHSCPCLAVITINITTSLLIKCILCCFRTNTLIPLVMLNISLWTSTSVSTQGVLAAMLAPMVSITFIHIFAIRKEVEYERTHDYTQCQITLFTLIIIIETSTIMTKGLLL